MTKKTKQQSMNQQNNKAKTFSPKKTTTKPTQTPVI